MGVRIFFHFTHSHVITEKNGYHVRMRRIWPNIPFPQKVEEAGIINGREDSVVLSSQSEAACAQTTAMSMWFGVKICNLWQAGKKAAPVDQRSMGATVL